MGLLFEVATDFAVEGLHVAMALNKNPSSVLGRLHKFYGRLTFGQRMGIAATEGVTMSFFNSDTKDGTDKLKDATFDAGFSMTLAAALDYTLDNHSDKIRKHLVSVKDYVMKAGYAAPENSPIGRKLPRNVHPTKPPTGAVDDALREIAATRESTQRAADTEQAKAVPKKLRKRPVNPGDVAKEETKVVAKETTEELETKALRKARSLKVFGGLGVAAFGVASFLDVSNHLDDKKKISRQQRQDDKGERQQELEQHQAMQQLLGGWGHVNMGQMALDLFNERTGHHKMGNAKFV